MFNANLSWHGVVLRDVYIWQQCLEDTSSDSDWCAFLSL